MTELQSIVWLTQDAYDKLAAELEYLKGEGRAAVAAKIGQARSEGDLSENGGYHAAREEQAHQEARIRQLEAMLRDAQIGEPAGQTGLVTPGMEVTICYDDDPDDTDTFVLGSRELLALTEGDTVEVYSPQSPLGAAVLGKKVGDNVSYTGPTGRTFDVRILDIKPHLT